MGLLPDSNTPPPTRYNGIRSNSSIYNTTIPLLLGQHRLSWKMLWYGNLISAQAQQPGGSGLGKGGSQWVYTASLIGLVCQGPCSALLNVWDGVGRFLLESASEAYTVPSGGGSYAVQNASIYGNDQGVSIPTPYSVVSNDYGSPGPVIRSGIQNVPMSAVPSSPGANEYSVDPATGTYSFSNDSAGNTVLVNYSYYRYQIITSELAVVPLTAPYQITVQEQPEFKQDEGVTYYPSGVALSPVGGTPTATGTYNPNNGNYLFAPGDAGVGVNISYHFNDPNTDNNAPNSLNLTLFGGTLGQSVWSYLESDYAGQSLGYSQLCYIGSSGLYLGFSPVLPQYNFEIAGPYQFGGGIVDACPSDCIEAILTDSGIGVGFPLDYLQVGSETNVPLALANGNFETGSAIPPFGWVDQASPTLSYDTTTKYAGTQSLVLSVTDKNIGVVATETYTCSAGQTFILTGAIKRNSGGMLPVIYVQFYDSGGSPLALTNYIGTEGTAWYNFPNYEFVCPPGAATFKIGTACLYLTGASTTVWEVDNITITQVNITPGLQSTIRNYWCANNFFISAVLDNQSPVGTVISDWLEAGQVMCFWSEGLLKFTPLGDTTAVANGYTFLPPTNPILSLDYDDFTPAKNGDPIQVERSPWQSRYNRVQVGWAVRTNEYNQDVMVAQDEASIDRNAQLTGGSGLIIESSQSWEFITTEDAAQWAANLRVQRSTSVANKFKVNAKAIYDYLEPGDIIELTDGIDVVGAPIGPLGLFETPVRILKITNDPVKGLEFEVENFPWSIGTAVLYPKQGQLPPGLLDAPHADPGNTVPLVFEAPSQLGLYNGNNLYMFANGENPNWGGCQVWVSYDGVNYNLFGTIQTPARIGVTTADYPASPSPDNTDTLTVNMQQSGAVLLPVSQANRDALVSLSAIASVGSVISPQLTAQSGTQNSSTGSAGPLTVSAGYNDPGDPDPPWVNPSGVTGTSTFATVNVTPADFDSGYLLMDFTSGGGFDIPSAATITGLSVSFTAAASAPFLGSDGYELAWYMKNASGHGGFGDMVVTIPLSSTPATFTYTYPPGYFPHTVAALTSAAASSPEFGLTMFARNVSGGDTIEFSIQDVTISLQWSGAGTGVAWVNPGNVSSASVYATATFTSSVAATNILTASEFGFAVPFGFVPTGIQVDLNALISNASGAFISVQLTYDGYPIGMIKAISPITSGADYTLGSSIDLWNLDVPLSTAQLNDPSFGVLIEAQGADGAIVSINNVRITLYGESVTNLELIAYEGAELVGGNTYALTSCLRGVYGTTSIDHPAGSQFARLDQASLIYQYDPTYSGSLIYLKFLSFNLYGNQLQQLGNVLAYELQLVGVGAGAFDAKTGEILVGTKNSPVPFLDAAVSAVHGAYGVNFIPAKHSLIGPASGQGTPLWQRSTIPNVTEQVGAYGASAWDVVLCDTTSGGFNVTLPPTASNPDAEITIQKISSDGNSVAAVITGGSGDSIVGGSNISAQNGTYTYVADAVNYAWRVVVKI